MPEVYLWQQQVDAETGKQKFSIVDGQQRLTSIVQYISNEWPLRTNYLDEPNQKAAFAGMFWKDLGDELKQVIWNYVINVRTIPSTVSEDEIRLVFTRLNETDKSLNPQEWRNAKFDGEFLKAAVELADSDEMKLLGVFDNKLNIRRMEDVDFANQLLIYQRTGITSDTPSAINKVYDSFNDVYAERDADIQSAKTKLLTIAEIFAADEAVKKFFGKSLQLYTLYCVVDIVGIHDPKLIIGGLQKFVAAYNSNEEDGTGTIAKYREGSSFRTRSKGSRENRVYGLLPWVKE